MQQLTTLMTVILMLSSLYLVSSFLMPFACHLPLSCDICNIYNEPNVNHVFVCVCVCVSVFSDMAVQIVSTVVLCRPTDIL